MRAGIELERVIAGVGLILLAALAAAGAGLGLLLSPIIAFLPPDELAEAERSMLLTELGLVTFAVVQVMLAVFVMSGRHSQFALALATGLVAIAMVVVRPGPPPLILVGVAATCAIALLIGTLRDRRGQRGR